MCIRHCSKSFWLIVVCFYVFNVILRLFVNHLKDFLWFTDCLTIGVLIHPWSHGRINDLSLDFFNNSRTVVIIRACVWWALFVATLTSTVHYIYIYVYIYIYILSYSNVICLGTVSEPKVKSSGNTMPHPQVQALIHRPVFSWIFQYYEGTLSPADHGLVKILNLRLIFN